MEEHVFQLKFTLPFIFARLLRDKIREGGPSVLLSGKRLYRVVVWGPARHFFQFEVNVRVVITVQAVSVQHTGDEVIINQPVFFGVWLVRF